MSFIDKIKGGITKGGSVVGSGAKYAVDMAKLNGRLSAEKKSISDLYTQIGEMICESFSSSAPDEVRELIDRISEHKKELERINDEIKKVKGVAVCPFCNSEIVSDSRFCNICGKELPMQDTDAEFAEE